MLNPERLARQFKTSIVDENLELYRSLFESSPAESVTDPYWEAALSLYNQMTSEQKPVFIQILRQVMIDTTSNILGVLDGVSTLEGADDDLVLKSKTIGDELSGELQDLFLTLFEDE
ncbi:MAG: hypothetical protein PF795_06515 [Kiritimatiellae bacterium]|jgi:hypothetical protein|nr:hypothetical protein [Kiritimatiellia bacterium]